MSFLSNKSVNYLNLHNGFVELLNQIMLVFGAPFLLQHGFSVAKIFFFYGLISCGRILCRLFAFPLLQRFGLRTCVAMGLVGFGIALSLLSQAQGINVWYAAFLTAYILFNPMYWLCFHIYYTLTSEERHRGKQYAVRGVIILSGQALFPLLSAWFIHWLGYSWYFALAIPVASLSLTFLLLCPDIEIPKRSWVFPKEPLHSVGVRTGLFLSFYDSISSNAWIFTTFLFFGGKLVTFGSVITFGIIMQICCQLLIGHRFDKGHIKELANIGGGTMCMVILGRALAPLSLPLILLLELSNSVARLHIRSVVEVATYNESHHAEHIIWYWVFTEMARDLGNVLGTWSASLLIFGGVEPRVAILLAMPAVMGLWAILKRITFNNQPVN